MRAITFEMIPTFEIVESPVLGDPLAALREQKLDWRTLLHSHIHDSIQTPSWHRELMEESSFQGFAPDAFDLQPGDIMRFAMEMAAIHDNNEDRSGSMPADLLAAMQKEIQGIFDGNIGNVEFRHFTFDEEGNMIEI